MTYLDELRNAVEKSAKCSAHFEQFTPVHETDLGEIVWQGDVAIFLLDGHPKARRCYAWGFPTDDEAKSREVTTILEIPPVVSALTAVRAAIAGHKQGPSSFN
jgi:hypothetical protein